MDSLWHPLSTSLPNIAIYATGGTTGGSASSADQIMGYQAGALGVQALIDAVPQMCNVFNHKHELEHAAGTMNTTHEHSHTTFNHKRQTVPATGDLGLVYPLGLTSLPPLGD
ncbi:hypothetical protein BKA56DRAFT_626102 [Ilyonectria sp. MPI-CAGE-AT-0026]|nr:hypothetical protein BKA56DRAFT_626102 [Ilyonectria sp. MPI-CAGE-AT-0026]